MQENPLKLKKIHHIEFWVGNARQAAFYYRKGFGFSQMAYSGLETGRRDATSYLLNQGRANFVFTTPLKPEHPASDRAITRKPSFRAEIETERIGSPADPALQK